MTETTDLRTLDRQVVEKVLGWQREDVPPVLFWRTADGWVHDEQSLPPFTSDTAEGWAAMKLVVERMKAVGFQWEMNQGAYGWDVALWAPDHNYICSSRVCADTLPEAVCRAALAAPEGRDA